MMRKFYKLILIFTVSYIYCSAALANGLKLAPILNISNNNSKLTVSYTVQCQESLVGHVISKGSQPDTWHVGLLLDSQRYRCVAAPKTATLELPLFETEIMGVNDIKNARFKPIDERRVSHKLRWAENVSFESTPKHKYVKYWGGCDKYIGVAVLHPVEVKRPRVGIIESENTKSNTNCYIKEKKTYFPSLLFAETKTDNLAKGFRAFAPKRVKERYGRVKDYRQSLALIDTSKIKRKKDQVVIPYFRLCQQVPLGLVVKEKKAVKEKKEQTFQIGLLLAEDPTVKCPKKRKYEWQTYTANLPFPKNAKFESMYRKYKKLNVRVHSPTIGPLNNPDKMQVKTKLKKCEATIGTFYGHNPRFTALGVAAVSHKKLCEKTRNRAIVYQPPMLRRMGGEPIYPIQF